MGTSWMNPPQARLYNEAVAAATKQMQAADGSSGGNLESIFKGDTSKYKAGAPVYGNMPMGVNMPAFMPGQQEAIANQLSQAYGQPASAYQQQMGQVYAPMNTTRLFEPITTTARAFGMEHAGKPGQWETDKKDGMNPEGYQQWGMDTNSPWLNQIFGLKPGLPDPAAVVPEEVKKKKTKTSGSATGGSSYTPRSGGIW